MDHKKIIVIGVVILGILTLFMVVDYKNKNGLGGQTLSPNILYITQPVTSFSGKVEKIEGNVVSISSQYALLQTAPIAITVMPNQPPVMPTPQTKTVIYKLLVTDKTQINQPATFINYLLKTVTPAPQTKLTIEDVKVGQMIMVNSAVDLRTLKSNQFEATMINLPPINNTLNGKIVKITNNSLTLKAFAPVAAVTDPQEKEYTIHITQDTEISRNIYSTNMNPEEPPTPPKPEKLAISDLKADMQVTAYTSEDVTETQTLTALRIEPAQEIPSITPPASEAEAPASASPMIEL
jgi:hypothetical protein